MIGIAMLIACQAEQCRSECSPVWGRHTGLCYEPFACSRSECPASADWRQPCDRRAVRVELLRGDDHRACFCRFYQSPALTTMTPSASNVNWSSGQYIDSARCDKTDSKKRNHRFDKH